MEPASEDLSPYLDGIKESSSRVRTITVVATTLCMIILAACWNQEEFSWFHGKDKRYAKLELWFELESFVLKSVLQAKKETSGSAYDRCVLVVRKEWATTNLDQDSLVSAENGAQFLSTFATLEHPELVRSISTCIGHLFDEEVKWRKKGKGWVCHDCPARATEYVEKRLKGDGVKDAREDAAYFRKQLLDATETVNISALGLRFHVNDIGTIGCFSLFIVMVWLRLSLWRHLSNLRQTFGKAQELGQVRSAYQLMAMHQIITLPPLDSDPLRGRPLFWSGAVVYSLPLLVVVAVLATDLMTMDRALKTYPVVPYVSLGSTVVLLLLIAWATFASFALQIEILGTWRDNRLQALRNTPEAST